MKSSVFWEVIPSNVASNRKFRKISGLNSKQNEIPDLLILSESIDMQHLYLYFLLFFHYMFRLHAAIFKWLHIDGLT
jgi:hypothetical protein